MAPTLSTASLSAAPLGDPKCVEPRMSGRDAVSHVRLRTGHVHTAADRPFDKGTCDGPGGTNG